MAELKDSGSRQEFSTGAVRDIQEGKGRFDLLPLDVCTSFFPDNIKTSGILTAISEFQDTGDEVVLIKHVAIPFIKVILNEDPTEYLLELAQHFEDGAKKYGDNNWKKGIPVNRYIDSALRHLTKYSIHWTDEPHDRAFVWNLVACTWTCIHLPELNPYGPHF